MPRSRPTFLTTTVTLALLGLLLLFPAPARAAKDSRIALVIGNSDYPTSPLKNPANDADDIAQSLKKLGFEVTLIKDGTHRQMNRAVRNLSKALSKGGVGLFYYAGHGIQVDGVNYLVPVDADIQSEADVPYEALAAGRVLDHLELAENRMNIIILDACRNNPFARSFRSGTQGLARMDAPTGSIMAYSTAPGSVAADGDGRNGVYTKHLLEAINTPGLDIYEAFMDVRKSVMKDTAGAQVPWESSSLTGDFFFRKAEPKPEPVPVALPAPTPAPAQPNQELLDQLAAMQEQMKQMQAAQLAAQQAKPEPDNRERELEAQLVAMQEQLAELKKVKEQPKPAAAVKPDPKAEAEAEALKTQLRDMQMQVAALEQNTGTTTSSIIRTSANIAKLQAEARKKAADRLVVSIAPPPYMAMKKGQTSFEMDVITMLSRHEELLTVMATVPGADYLPTYRVQDSLQEELWKNGRRHDPDKKTMRKLALALHTQLLLAYASIEVSKGSWDEFCKFYLYDTKTDTLRKAKVRQQVSGITSGNARISGMRWALGKVIEEYRNNN